MITTLVSLPPRMAATLGNAAGAWLRHRLQAEPDGPVFAGADPTDHRLGSGGGTVHLLHQAYLAQPVAGRPSLDDWLAAGPRLVLHAGGESRRLPAYAAVGKVFMPLPVIPGRRGQRYDQMLCDLQLPAYAHVLREAGPQAAAMVCSGDVWLDFDPLQVPPFAADFGGIGMTVSPEVAQHFGVFFVRRAGRVTGPARTIAFFLQKPAPERIREHLGHYEFFVDTGMWLLSAAALRLLFRACGWDPAAQRFATPGGVPGFLDLYTEIGCALGDQNPAPPRLHALGFESLRSTVIPLTDAEFHHVGTSRQLLDCLDHVQSQQLSRRTRFVVAGREDCLAPGSGHRVWLDRVAAPVLAHGHNLVTGLPAAAAIGELPSHLCLDLPPLGPGEYGFRPYHLDDSLRGDVGAESRICGQPAGPWLAARGFTDFSGDVFDLPIYPVLSESELTTEWLAWFLAVTPDPALTRRAHQLQRRSARQLADATDLEAVLAARRTALATTAVAALLEAPGDLDLDRFGQDFAALAALIREVLPSAVPRLLAAGDALVARLGNPVQQARLKLFLSVLAAPAPAARLRDEGFAILRAAIVRGSEVQPAAPQLGLKRDQIVWARSPVRLDLAGGWTDTPPHCLEFGGSVLNVAVMLNGQPPIQVIGRCTETPDLRVRSIDLGQFLVINTYEDLAGYRDPRSPFSLPKAALALAGFHPEFYAGNPYPSLERQLADFGGGLELSLICAVPKGSGLGTSSILAAVLLGALNRCCSLHWDEVAIYHRVLAMEQLLTTGGGWQDQAGAIFRGIKLVTTTPGPAQAPTVRYAPEHVLGPGQANERYLLYYTGITRLAKGILQEIVNNMFLGDHRTLAVLDLIQRNSQHAYQAVVTGNPERLGAAVRRSWMLNKMIDRDTTSPQIEQLIAGCGDDLAGCKLLGAGGGGYLFICARDAEAGRRIRARLEANPPNALARFVDFAVAETGLQVTVS